MRVQKSYIEGSSAQVTAPGLFRGFSFRGFEELKEGDSWINTTAQRKEPGKEQSKTEFGKKNSEEKFGESDFLPEQI